MDLIGADGVLGQVLIDFPAPDAADHTAAMAINARFVERWRGHALMTPAIAPPGLAPWAMAT